MKSVLVTGGAGYIGSHTVQALVAQNTNVVVLDNLTTGNREAVMTPHFYQGDIADERLVREIIRKHQIDAVIHFAAKSIVSESIQNPELYFYENTEKSCHFFETVVNEGVKQIVFSSTAAVYGTAQDKPIPENEEIKPINPYGESKAKIEKYLHLMSTVHPIRWIALRYFNAAGASLDGTIGEDHQPESHLIPLILQTVLGKREVISIFGDDYPTMDGTCIRDYIHVLDLAHAHILALQSLQKDQPLKQNIYNIGTGFGHSVKEIIQTTEHITGKKIKQKIEQRRIGDPPVLIADSRYLQEHLGWKPRFSDLKTIIETAWKWFEAYPNGYKQKTRVQ
ncbi:UDP-glucose 4-epimerase GalE [Shimazuella kribbensis]|uniref:UDP-glucose 4-epimerase GalE n=1 Tax=Shimazuella kribbensis TaxID=139808 RepID=UPI000411A634|nr:UDP-glucose 4-epimerase GalE [Shimazuella kribbensis]